METTGHAKLHFSLPCPNGSLERFTLRSYLGLSKDSVVLPYLSHPFALDSSKVLSHAFPTSQADLCWSPVPKSEQLHWQDWRGFVEASPKAEASSLAVGYRSDFNILVLHVQTEWVHGLLHLRFVSRCIADCVFCLKKIFTLMVKQKNILYIAACFE